MEVIGDIYTRYFDGNVGWKRNYVRSGKEQKERKQSHWLLANFSEEFFYKEAQRQVAWLEENMGSREGLFLS